MADLDLDAVKARCDAAPPGPWAAIDGGEDRDWHGMPLDWMVRHRPNRWVLTMDGIAEAAESTDG